MESWFKFGALAWSQTWVPKKAVSVITSTSICLALSKYTIIIIIIQTKWKTCWFLLVDDLQNTCMNFKPGLTWQNKHEHKQLMQHDKPFAHWYPFLEQNVLISMLLTNQNLVSKKCQISNIRRLQGCHYISPTSEQKEECGLQQMLTIILFVFDQLPFPNCLEEEFDQKPKKSILCTSDARWLSTKSHQSYFKKVWGNKIFLFQLIYFHHNTMVSPLATWPENIIITTLCTMENVASN